MPEIRPPRLSTTADVQTQLATAPHWPLIDGSKPPTARRYRVNSPGPTTAA
jgi:hypothetical protein